MTYTMPYMYHYTMNGEGITTLQALLGGMTSGSISTMCNNPADMIKTRMQGLGAPQYNGFLDCFVFSIQNSLIFSQYKYTGWFEIYYQPHDIAKVRR